METTVFVGWGVEWTRISYTNLISCRRHRQLLPSFKMAE